MSGLHIPWWAWPLITILTLTTLPIVLFIWFMGSVHSLAGIEYEDEGDGE